MATVNQKIYSADQFKQKMENSAADLQAKRLAERKRIDNVRNLKQQAVALEKELEELTALGNC